MNELSQLAYEITKYGYQEDNSRFPISYISGWFETNVGQLNILIGQDFFVNESGNFEPRPLTSEEASIFHALYEGHYYDKMRRDTLRGLNTAGDGDCMLFKEGDTTIQKSSKTSVASAFTELGRENRSRLRELVFQYNMGQATPTQKILGRP